MDALSELPVQFWTLLTVIFLVFGALAFLVILRKKARGGFIVAPDKVSAWWDNADKEAKAEGENKAEVLVQTEKALPSPNYTFLWHKYASLFWLGNDIMWTKAALRDGWSARKIEDGLRECIRHSKALGLHDTLVGKELGELLNIAHHKAFFFQLGGLSEEEVINLYTRLEVVKQFVSELASAYELDQTGDAT